MAANPILQAVMRFQHHQATTPFMPHPSPSVFMRTTEKEKEPPPDAEEDDDGEEPEKKDDKEKEKK